MDGIIAVIFAGFVLLLFVLVFQKRNNKRVKLMMQQNRNVEPLFKETAAKNKYQTLYNTLKMQPAAQRELSSLHQQFLDKKITVDAYDEALEELGERWGKE